MTRVAKLQNRLLAEKLSMLIHCALQGDGADFSAAWPGDQPLSITPTVKVGGYKQNTAKWSDVFEDSTGVVSGYIVPVPLEDKRIQYLQQEYPDWWALVTARFPTLEIINVNLGDTTVAGEQVWRVVA